MILSAAKKWQRKTSVFANLFEFDLRKSLATRIPRASRALISHESLYSASSAAELGVANNWIFSMWTTLFEIAQDPAAAHRPACSELVFDHSKSSHPIQITTYVEKFTARGYLTCR